jgi:Fe-S-cluster containining protein
VNLIEEVKQIRVSAKGVSTEVVSKCDACQALCCQYITQEIDTPTTKKAFDILLWQISHKGVHIFKDCNGWYLLINTPCTHLLEDNRCGIYLKRPEICREHSTEGCERDVPIDEGCDLYFQSYQELDDYCRQRFKRWDERFEPKPKDKSSKNKKAKKTKKAHQ